MPDEIEVVLDDARTQLLFDEYDAPIIDIGDEPLSATLTEDEVGGVTDDLLGMIGNEWTDMIVRYFDVG